MFQNSPVNIFVDFFDNVTDLGVYSESYSGGRFRTCQIAKLKLFAKP